MGEPFASLDLRWGTPEDEMEEMEVRDAMAVTSSYRRNPDVVLREEDEDGALLFNPDTNQVKVLNSTGLVIWKLCDGGHSVLDMEKALVEAFEGAEAEAVGQDVETFLSGLVQSKFVEPDPSP